MDDVAAKLRALAGRWSPAKPHERGSAQSYLIELCEALGVERPRPPGSGYEFELTIDSVAVDGRESKNFIDLWKRDHFALEAKDDKAAKDGQRANDTLLRKAFGQVVNYARQVSGDPPPYVMVLDVGRTLIVWDRWSGSYGGFNAGHRIALPTLHERPEDVALLRDIWEKPSARDPRARAQAVTREVAARLARLAAALEARGFEQERVAKFLMRVVFSCFAEDIGLLPQEAFRQTVTEAGLKGSPEQFAEAVTGLWRAMDQGGYFGFLKFLKFNGHFFRDAEALPLSREDLVLLQQAAEADWKDVEPAIFGTLLVRALDPKERHRLGAEYTPREFVERLVRPTVEEPIRGRWTAVQAEVLQLRESGKPKDRATAEARLREFHEWLRGLRFLDPACGSGNFLYVTMLLVKSIEVEVIRAIEEITGHQALRFEEVGPWQFYGIEVKAWAREIAELVLWIGFHQFWRRHHSVQPGEPILRDTGTLENRDAVLAWDTTRHDETRDRQDPTPRLTHPVTGETVPDPAAKLPYMTYAGARPATWPDADFVIGNPPYMGGTRMREAFGDGYVDALRDAYPTVPEGADYVMFWWLKAAESVASGRVIRAGLITTNSIVQRRNRAVVEAAAKAGARVVWAVPDHPWTDGSDDAAVRVAMTVITRTPPSATRVEVDEAGQVRREVRAPMLNSDLSVHADVASAARVPLLANSGLSSNGFYLRGAGFVLEREEADRVLRTWPESAHVIRRFTMGRDLTARPRGLYVIDFASMTEGEAAMYPGAFEIVRDRVLPERLGKKEKQAREVWWQFWRVRGELRTALSGLRRYIATPYVSKHRHFTFLPAEQAPDDTVIAIASDDAFHLGVLSSSIHGAWALAAGGRMGVGNDPRYNKSMCLDPFPFPEASGGDRAYIAHVAERLLQHRRHALGAGARITVTGIYNVLDKLRSGEPLDSKEREVHTAAACGVLRDLHDELDRAVASAYGWSWPEPPALILERLVALHDERVEEEKAGRVRWLRPEYQVPRFGRDDGAAVPLGLPESTEMGEVAVEPAPWPTDAVGQITALRALAAAAPLSVEEALRHFAGARRDLVARHLETLALLGEVLPAGDGRYGVPAMTY